MNATPAASGTSAAELLPNDLAPGLMSLSDDVLLRALDEAKENEVRLRKQIEQMQRRLASTQEEAKILTKLVALRSGDTPVEPVDETVRMSLTPPSVTKSGQHALEAAIAILTEAARPVHISDLMRQLSEKNVQIPGSGTQANLISHLRRDKRIIRPSRGMYGLAAWGLTEMPSQSKRRRKRRHSR